MDRVSAAVAILGVVARGIAIPVSEAVLAEVRTKIGVLLGV